MIREYKFSKTAKILTFIIAPLLIAACIYGGFIAEIKASNTLKIIIAAVASSFIFCVIMSIIEVIKTKLIIEDDCFIKTRIFSTRTLLFKEVKGYRENENNIFIISKTPSKKDITVIKYFNNSCDIIAFLNKKYANLDKRDLRKQEKERNEKIYNNKKLGKSKIEIAKKIKELKKITVPLNWLAAASSIMLIFRFLNYEFITIINVLIPIIGFVVVIKSKGLVHLMPEEDDTSFPTLNSTLSLPACALAISVIKDYYIFEYINIWIITILCTGIIIYLLKKYTYDEFIIETNLEKIFTYSFVSAFVAFNIFFSLLQINCIFDYKEGVIFETEVVYKETKEDSEDNLTYYIVVDDWVNKTDMNEFKVSWKRYNELNISKRVNVIVKDGLLGIPWYYLDK